MPWLIGIVLLAVVGSLIAALTSGAPGGVPWMLVGVLAIAIASAVALDRAEVIVDQTCITVRLGRFGWPRRTFPWPGVREVAAIDVRPTEWGGWGYRWVPWRRGTAAVMRAGDGLRIERRDGRVFVVTVDDAAAGATAARAFLAP